MTSYKDQGLRRELIMKHYSSPNNKGDVSGLSNVVDHYSTQCVDELHLSLNIKDDKIVDSKFAAEGCAVFLSSTDIMLDTIKNKSIDEVKEIIKNYELMVNTKPGWDPKILGELAIYENVATHLNRLHCAVMVSDAIKKAILLP